MACCGKLITNSTQEAGGVNAKSDRSDSGLSVVHYEAQNRHHSHKGGEVQNGHEFQNKSKTYRKRPKYNLPSRIHMSLGDSSGDNKGDNGHSDKDRPGLFNDNGLDNESNRYHRRRGGQDRFKVDEGVNFQDSQTIYEDQSSQLSRKRNKGIFQVQERHNDLFQGSQERRLKVLTQSEHDSRKYFFQDGQENEKILLQGERQSKKALVQSGQENRKGVEVQSGHENRNVNESNNVHENHKVNKLQQNRKENDSQNIQNSYKGFTINIDQDRRNVGVQSNYERLKDQDIPNRSAIRKRLEDEIRKTLEDQRSSQIKVNEVQNTQHIPQSKEKTHNLESQKGLKLNSKLIDPEDKEVNNTKQNRKGLGDQIEQSSHKGNEVEKRHKIIKGLKVNSGQEHRKRNEIESGPETRKNIKIQHSQGTRTDNEVQKTSNVIKPEKGQKNRNGTEVHNNRLTSKPNINIGFSNITSSAVLRAATAAYVLTP